MQTCTGVQKKVIRSHYDLSTPFYRLLWGPHIHHGLWEANESPRTAQLQLTERLATLAQITVDQQLLDIGCGMGASSIHLAKTRKCRCLGVTISPLQQRWASLSSRWHRVASRTEFLCIDAEQIELPVQSHDVVWSVECTEHLFDKARFFERAASWLKPGGTMAICAWLAGDTSNQIRTQQVHDICEGFFCPSLGTSDDYAQWMENAGLQVEHNLDWTTRVSRTWEICSERVQRSRVRWLAPILSQDSVLFLDRFDSILAAYRSGAMKYGCFIARKKPNA
jgi:cyclopropane fatty-acyl-phospholipid synthase-like methyltransferase